MEALAWDIFAVFFGVFVENNRKNAQKDTFFIDILTYCLYAYGGQELSREKQICVIGGGLGSGKSPGSKRVGRSKRIRDYIRIFPGIYQ